MDGKPRTATSTLTHLLNSEPSIGLLRFSNNFNSVRLAKGVYEPPSTKTVHANNKVLLPPSPLPPPPPQLVNENGSIHTRKLSTGLPREVTIRPHIPSPHRVNEFVQKASSGVAGRGWLVDNVRRASSKTCADVLSSTC